MQRKGGPRNEDSACNESSGHSRGWARTTGTSSNNLSLRGRTIGVVSGSKERQTENNPQPQRSLVTETDAQITRRWPT
ncbi:hypothetical protein RSAG8_08123, partial [Rhizoctonia solani AG-8 WAC10335]